MTRAFLVVALLLPLALLAWLLVDPVRNAPFVIPVEHLTATTNVSVLALAVAALVARASLQQGQYRALLVACGFLCMAGIFVVHGLSTPGVLIRGADANANAVVGVSAQLALLVPAVFFALRYTPIAEWFEGRWIFQPPRLLALISIALLAYGVVGLQTPDMFREMLAMMSVYSGGSYAGGTTPTDQYSAAYQQGLGWSVPVTAAVTIALLGFATWRQLREFMRSSLPMHGALVASFLFLAQAQVSMVLSPTWTPSWWEYHGLMLGAVVIALGSLFVELDRRRGLERFLPSTVVDRVLTGERLGLGGERKLVTILFADLRGSTALAEELTPEAIVGILNAYLGAMARSVFANGGILDKFLGDGLMAIFGAMGDPSDGATAAARAALEMRHVIADLNAGRAARGEPQIRFGVGIHTGEVVLGAVGLPERSDYTALGDTVNTASRLESLTKEYDVDAVLSSETARRLEDGFSLRELGTLTVRGKTQPMTVSTLA